MEIVSMDRLNSWFGEYSPVLINLSIWATCILVPLLLAVRLCKAAGSATRSERIAILGVSGMGSIVVGLATAAVGIWGVPALLTVIGAAITIGGVIAFVTAINLDDTINK